MRNVCKKTNSVEPDRPKVKAQTRNPGSVTLGNCHDSSLPQFPVNKLCVREWVVGIAKFTGLF